MGVGEEQVSDWKVWVTGEAAIKRRVAERRFVWCSK